MKSVTLLLGRVGFSRLLLVVSRESRHRLLFTVLFAALSATSAWSQQASLGTTSNQQPSGKTETELPPASKQQVLASYGRLPLSFEVNRGQTDDQVKFLSRRPGFSLFLTPTEAVLALSKPLEERDPKTLPGARPVEPRKVLTSALHVRLVGANPAVSVDGLEKMAAKSNYFIGNDPKKWQTNVPNYAKVKYVSVYPGVDLVYYGNEGKVEHDFLVSPGADAGAITLGFDKREKLRIDEHGEVVVKGKIGEVRLEKPVIYQDVGGIRQQVAGGYVWKGRNQIGFRVGKYDVTKTLVIDPVLSYSTYVSPTLASGGASANGIAVDSVGSAYVTGWTNSSTFSPTAGAFQTTYPNTTTAFVVKLDATGSSVIYSTYLGGGGFGSNANGIAVDSMGSAYVTGTTYSTNFPTTSGAFQAAFAGSNGDAFVTKLTADGSGLVYSTYLGGCFPGAALSSSGIAVDSTGSAYVTGQVGCRSFPTTTGAYETSPDACFVTKFNPSGSGLSYSTFFGDHYATFCNAIALDSAGSAYITGYSEGTLPTTSGAFQPAQVPRPSAYSAFVTKFNPAGSGLVYSTYLTGNSNGDVGQGIAVDSAGYAYVTGWIGPPNTNFTASTSFPTTPGAFQTTFSGTDKDAFVTKLNLDGTGLIYSTYLGDRISGLGGAGGSPAPQIAVDSAGSASVTGITSSPSFPTTPDAFQRAYNGIYSDAFVTKLTADGSGLIYSTYLGGHGQTQGLGIAVDLAGAIYVTGPAYSQDFPTTAGAVYPINNSSLTSSGFVSKFDFSQPSVSILPPALTFPDTAVGQPSTPLPVTFYVSGSGALAFSNIKITGINPGDTPGDFAIISNGCSGVTLAVTTNSSCAELVGFTPTAGGTRTAELQFTYDGSGSPQTVPLSGTGLSQASTTTTLTSSLNSAQFGQSVTFTAMLSSIGAGTPTGSVAFYDGAASLGSSVLTGTQATFTISSLSVGAHSITAVYGGNTNFNSSTSLAVTETVNKATASVTLNVANKTYDATVAATITACTPTGVLMADTNNVSCTVGSATFADANVGNGKTVTATGLSLTGSAAGNYQLSATTATATANITPLAVTPNITANNKVYDGTTVATIAGRSLSGVLSGDAANVNLSGGTATFSDANVGTGKPVTVTGLSLTGSAAGNYQLSATTATATANITPLAVTPNVTAANKVYDGTTVATITSQSVAGVLSSDTANVSLSGGTATFSDANVGMGKTVTVIGLSLTGSAVGNYQLSAASATTMASITPKSVTASITAATKSYDGTVTATITACTPTGVLMADTNNVSCIVGSATFADANVGNGKTVTATGLSLTGSAAGNYQLSGTTSTTTASITALVVTPSITANNKVYDGTTAATIASRSLSGVLSGDAANANLSGGTATFSDANVATGKQVTVTGLSLTGSAGGNYQLSGTTATTTANITALVLTPSITANNKVYDGTTVATIAGRSLSGVLSGDAANVNLSGGAATFSDASVGTGKPVTVTGLSLTGSAAGNYQLSATTATATANITPLAVTPNITAANKVYDGTTVATITSQSVAGVLSSDTANVSLSGGTATFSDANVGMGKTVTVTGLSLTGSAAGNYQLSGTTATTTASITALVLTPSITANNKVYDGTTVAAIAGRSLSGVLSGDAANANLSGGTATFSDANVGTGKPVTVTGLSLTGSAAGNYQLSGMTATTTANITALVLTPTITVASKSYDGTVAATITACTPTSVLIADTNNVSCTVGSATFADANVGNGKTVTATGLSLTGSAAGNYQLSAASATTMANITPKSVTPSITANSKIYDGTTAATIAGRLLSGVLSGDAANANLSGGTATFSDANVGTGKPVTVTGLSLTGSAAGNYQLSTATATTTANITQAPLTVAANNATRPFGAANPTFGGTITGVQAGDDITATYTTAAGPTSPVGTYAITPVLSDPGGRLGNYTVSSTNGSLAVTQATTTTNVSVSPAPLTYGDNASFSATVIPTSAGGQALTGTVQFSLGGSPVGSAVVSSGVATLSQVQVKSSLGSYPVTAAFSSPNSNFAGSTGTTTPNVTVNLKNAFILYTGDTIAQVGTSLTLRATVWDSAAAGYPGTPADTGPTAAIGDITKMWIEFDIYQAQTCGGGTPTTLYARVATTSTAGAGTATSMLNSSSEVSYCVVSKLVGGSSGGANSFYMAANAQPVGVDFYVNSGQFATGGGWVNDPTGSHGNFSFNARYNSTGSPKGQKVYTYRGSYNGVPADFIIKSNALTGLQFSGTTYPISATLQGKANVQVNRASDGYVLFSAGNYTFSATVTDSGQNGTSGKQFSLIVYDPSGVPYHSVPAGTPVQGGNVVIHSQ